MIEVLGIKDKSILLNDEKLEEFIVMRAITDTNAPKFNQNDSLIF